MGIIISVLTLQDIHYQPILVYFTFLLNKHMKGVSRLPHFDVLLITTTWH